MLSGFGWLIIIMLHLQRRLSSLAHIKWDMGDKDNAQYQIYGPQVSQPPLHFASNLNKKAAQPTTHTQLLAMLHPSSLPLGIDSSLCASSRFSSVAIPFLVRHVLKEGMGE